MEESLLRGPFLLTLQFSSLPSIHTKFKLYIIDKLSHQIILVRDNLEDHSIILNFREGIISVDYHIFEMIQDNPINNRYVILVNQI